MKHCQGVHIHAEEVQQFEALITDAPLFVVSAFSHPETSTQYQDSNTLARLGKRELTTTVTCDKCIAVAMH